MSVVKRICFVRAHHLQTDADKRKYGHVIGDTDDAQYPDTLVEISHIADTNHLAWNKAQRKGNARVQ